MSNDYFNNTTTTLRAGNRALASKVESKFDEVVAGFNKFPGESELKGAITYGTDSGAADAYVVTMPYTPTSYSDGMLVIFKAGNTNTGASTVNVDSLGVKSVVRFRGETLVAGDITASDIVSLRYSTTTGNFHLSSVGRGEIQDMTGYLYPSLLDLGSITGETAGILMPNLLEGTATGDFQQWNNTTLSWEVTSDTPAGFLDHTHSDLYYTQDNLDVTFAGKADDDHSDTHDPNDGADALDTAAPAELASVQAAGVGTAHSFARSDHVHQIQHSIANNHLVTVDDADAADNDFAKFTASGLEGRSYAEVKQDLDLEIGTDVLAQQTIGIADDNLLEVDDADAATSDYAKFTANGLQGRSYAEVKQDLDLEIGTDVLAQQTIGIANDNLVEVDDTDAADNDFAKFTAAGLEGRSYSEVRGDLDLEAGTDFVARAGGSFTGATGFSALDTYTTSTTQSIDFSKQNIKLVTLGAGTTTISVGTAPSTPGAFLMLIKQDGTGNRDITWDSSWLTFLITEPTWVNGGASKTIAISVVYDGTNYYCVGATEWES